MDNDTAEVGSIGVAMVEADVEDEGPKEFVPAVVEVKDGGGMR